MKKKFYEILNLNPDSLNGYEQFMIMSYKDTLNHEDFQIVYEQCVKKTNKPGLNNTTLNMVTHIINQTFDPSDPVICELYKDLQQQMIDNNIKNMKQALGEFLCLR